MIAHRTKKVVQLALLFAVLLAALLAPRLTGITKFTTGDEPAWLIFSHNFLHAIDQGQFERTVYEYHPAVTTMWVISAAILSYHPEYIQIRHGYIDKFWELDEIYARQGVELATVLYRSRMINVLLLTSFLILAFIFLWRLLGLAMAVTATVLVSFDPFYLGQSRLLNHEGMACAFALAAVLAALIYLYLGRKPLYLVISAAASGLALLTKSPMILLVPLVGLMFLVNLLEERRTVSSPGRAVWRDIGAYLAWLGVLAGVYVLLWPGMWVQPARMLYEIYANAFSYAFQGQRLLVTQQVVVKPLAFNLAELGYFLVAIMYKTTPVAWVGVVLSLAGLFVRAGAPLAKLAKLAVIYLGVLALLFIIMFGLARGRNSMHYILMVFVCLDVMAGIGYVWGVRLLAGRANWLSKPAAQVCILGAILLLQGLSALPDYPYYYTYTNPLVQAIQPGTQDPAAGYGEGLELAAAYLAQKPAADDLVVSAHMGVGPFSYYFPGASHPLMYSGADYLNDRSAQWFNESDYLVIYDIQQRPINLPSRLLAALAGVAPERTISINGLHYASIYKISELPQRVFDSLLPPD